ncbi:MAG: riboflavin biosynthesis protein RibF [Lentisphaeria bacterium]
MSQTPTIVSYPAELSGLRRKVVLAFGVFDGVHRGHQEILRQLKSLADEHSALPVLLFFHPSPKAVLFPKRAPKMLYPLSEKQALFQKYGISHLVCFPFTRELALLSPEEFLEKYLFSSGLDLAGFCVGQDWQFGHQNAGNADLLKKIATTRGITVRIVSPVWMGDAPISSTRIRNAIQSGNFAEAAALLGHPWCICGKVSHGLGLAGSKLRCPTANLSDPELLLPPWGIYAAKASLPNTTQPLKGIIYVGDAPTIRKDGHPEIIVELHLFDFSGDLYGQKLKIEPIEFLRPSRKFASEAELEAQICQDIARAKHVLG